MTRRSTIECDRCGALEGDDTRDRKAWGLIYAATLAGNDIVGSADTPADICGDCMTELRDVFAGPAT